MAGVLFLREARQIEICQHRGMDLYSYINNYSQNKTSLGIPKLVFHQADLIKYLATFLSVVSLILVTRREIHDWSFFIEPAIPISYTMPSGQRAEACCRLIKK
jgi:hypothetical protein